MKAELIYHGKYEKIGRHYDIVFRDELMITPPSDVLGVITPYTYSADSIIEPDGLTIEASNPIFILQGEGCPIEGFPPSSSWSNPNDFPF